MQGSISTPTLEVTDARGGHAKGPRVRTPRAFGEHRTDMGVGPLSVG